MHWLDVWSDIHVLYIIILSVVILIMQIHHVLVHVDHIDIVFIWLILIIQILVPVTLYIIYIVFACTCKLLNELSLICCSVLLQLLKLNVDFLYKHIYTFQVESDSCIKNWKYPYKTCLERPPVLKIHTMLAVEAGTKDHLFWATFFYNIPKSVASQVLRKSQINNEYLTGTACCRETSTLLLYGTSIVVPIAAVTLKGKNKTIFS